MAAKIQKRVHPKWIGLLVLLGLVDLGFVIRYVMQGQNIALLNPKGLIAHEQRSLMVFTISVLLIIAIPTLFMLFFTAWKYRESHITSTFDDHKRHGKNFELFLWGVPSIFMLVLASVMWPATHRLVPQKAIAADTKPLTIQVISLRWKWLFLYPDQNIATVNFVEIPINTPVQFELTADEAPMSSFWIPNLGGQLYSMTSHVNRLNLKAETLGDYPGSSAEINGAGFAGMKFTTRVSSPQEFNRWVDTVKQSPDSLDNTAYAAILQPSENNPPAFYSAYKGDLYDTVLGKYFGPGGHAH